MELSDAEKAEQLSARRVRTLWVLLIVFIGQQFSYFTAGDLGDRPLDHVRVAAWLVLSVIILVVLASGGGWAYPNAVRQLANDEATRVHRGRAFVAGFFASMIVCVIVYFVSMYKPVGGRAAVHLVMSAGIITTLFRFSVLEHRALRNG